jgi:hypothetical protein
LNDKDKIDILLKEYDTLRQEILMRINHRFLMLGIIGTLLGFVLINDNPQLRIHIFGLSTKIILLMSGALLLLALWLFLGYLLGTLAARISTIERQINEIAGKKLLEWESRHGWGRWGRFSGARKDCN